jgi:signal transduction histidine kinase
MGGFVLCGWIWDIEALKSIYGPITMKANTAIGLLLSGTALAIVRMAPPLTSALAFVAGAIGAATLTQHIAGWDLGIDQLLFTERPGAAATASPNRMGPNASTSFLLASIALHRLARGDGRGAAVAQKLSIGAVVLASIPLAGYFYGASELYGIAQFTGIALHSALAFLLLHAGILITRPDTGPVAAFLREGPAGTVLRRLALPVAAVPLLLGFLAINAVAAGIVDRGLGLGLYAVALIVVLGAIVWHTARVIEVSDRARRRAEEHRDTLIVSERQARAEAERASQLKDQFLATLSHELRTPLNVMLGWTQMLERGVKAADQARVAALVARNGRLLARLVEDLLDLSRVAAGQFEIARGPVALNGVVQGALEAIAPMANANGIAVDAALDPALETIDADGARLQQIVWNLLSNAVKFTRAGGRIDVRTARAGDGVVLTVIDTGVGFDEAFAPEIFKPFRQADPSVSREHGGLGLGLSIAKHLAELHGGTLTGSSPGVNRGATFTLTLPCRAPVPARMAAAR